MPRALAEATACLADIGLYGLVWLTGDLIVEMTYGPLVDFIQHGKPLTDSVLALIGLENDIRALTGFKDAVDYGASQAADEFEIGTVEDVRYIRSTIFESFADAGGNKGTMVSTSGVKADVYQIIYLAAHAAASVPLKGKKAITAPIVRNPGTISDSDKLGQRGHVGWKAYFGCVILNQLFISRLECGATEL